MTNREFGGSGKNVMQEYERNHRVHRENIVSLCTPEKLLKRKRPKLKSSMTNY